MHNYTITQAQRELIRPISRRFQAAVAILSNALIGSLGAQPNGIHKAEGGVVCNGREIAIKRDWVVDDLADHSLESTLEERARRGGRYPHSSALGG